MRLSILASRMVVSILILGCGLIPLKVFAGGLFDPNAEPPIAADLSGATSINIDTGATSPTITVVGGPSAGTLYGEVRTTTDGTAVAVFCFNSININLGTVTVTGSRSLSLLSRGNATIGQSISLDGGNGVAGLYNQTAPAFPGGAGGPGGFKGGDNRQAGSGPGAGLLGATHRGGGGGGYGGMGGTGFDTLAKGGAIYGSLYLTDLQGGSGGAAGNRQASTNTYNTSGGGGGGAIEIAALGTLTISPGATISANGGAGGVYTGTADCSFGGGGSGGAIRLSGANVVLNGALQANGGLGGDGTGTPAAFWRCAGGGGGGRIAIYYTGQMTGLGALSVARGLHTGNPRAYQSGESGYVGSTLVVNETNLKTSADTRFNPDDFAAVGTLPVGQTLALNTDSGLATANGVEIGHGYHGITAAGTPVAIFAFADGTRISNASIAGTRPAAILGKGDLIIDGAVNANGADGAAGAESMGVAGGGDGSDSRTLTWPSKGRGLGGGLGDSGTAGNSASGGGFGGKGGNASTNAILGGAAYGIPSLLDDLRAGSGGGGSDLNGGGAGGGALEILAKGLLTIEATGAVTANGGQGFAGTNHGSGGGSGGGILLSGDSMTILGSALANGGASSAGAGKKNGGGGGGGRIAIYSSGTLTIDSAAITTATGGASTGGDGSGAAGDNGTVAMAPMSMASPNPLEFRTLLDSTPATASITVSNGGTVPLNISSIVMTDAGAGGVFSISSVMTQSGTPLIAPYAAALSPAGYLTVVVAFSRVNETSTTGRITIASNDPVTPSLDVTLNGQSFIANWYVTADGLPGGPNPGLFQDHPTTTIQGAVASAANGDIIYMMEGVYDLTTPGVAPAGALTTQKSLTIYGGFDGSESQGGKTGLATDRIATYLTDNATTLTGAGILRAVNITAGSAGQTLLFDGLIFSNCSTVGASQNGGALNIVGVSQVTLANCNFVNNACSMAGGAILISTINGFITSGCLFYSNAAPVNTGNNGGGAIYISSSNTGPVTAQNCTFTSNMVYIKGGAIGIGGGPGATIGACEFSGNYTLSSGDGGAALWSTIAGSVISITDSIFSDNRSGSSGGALLISGVSQASIINCVFTGNTTANTGSGGAWYGGTANGLVTSGCQFANNFTRGTGEGGAMYMNTNAGSIILRNCSYTSNSANSYGGGLAANIGVNITIAGCDFTSNSTRSVTSNGGAAFFGPGMNAVCSITNSNFIGNYSARHGGALWAPGASTYSMDSCYFDSNKASMNAGVMIWNSNVTFDATNCVFTNNEALNVPAGNGNGGAFWHNSSGVRTNFVNCLFANNKAWGNYGGAIYRGAVGPLSMVNCTLVNNRAMGSANADGVFTKQGAATTNVFLNCLFYGHRIAIDTDAVGGVQAYAYNCAFDSTISNGTLDTQRVNCVMGDVALANVAAGDYHLLDTSAAIGAGALTAGGLTAPATDYDGASRPSPALTNPDAGAFESAKGTPDAAPPAPIVYVTATGAGAMDGLSWASAVKLPIALGIVPPNGRIFMKGGAGEIHLMPTSYTLTKGMSIYGGFAGLPTENDPSNRPGNYRTNYPTTISGQNLYRPLLFVYAGPVTLDALILTQGYSNTGMGGGVLAVENCGPLTMTDCTISDSVSEIAGGGARVAWSEMTMTRCQVTGNHTTVGRAGGLYIAACTGLIEDCVFFNNEAYTTSNTLDKGQGGGISAYLLAGGTLTIRNTRITSNTTHDNGAGAGFQVNDGNTNAVVVLDNCEIYDNHVVDGGKNVDQYGGGIYAQDATDLIITNCSIHDNIVRDSGTLTARGGGIGFANNASAFILNTDIVDNRASNDNTGDPYGGGCYLQDSTSVTLIGCRILRNSAYNIGDSGTDSNAFGGGISIHSTARVTMFNCQVNDNASTVSLGSNSGGKDCDGGGVLIKGTASLQMTSCTLIGNTAYSVGGAGRGGGMNMQEGAQVTLTNCVLARNTSENSAGAIRAYDNANASMMLKMINCSIVSNTMDGAGGNLGDGILIAKNLPPNRFFFINCLFDGQTRDAILDLSTVTTGGLVYNCVFGTNGFNSVKLLAGNIINSKQAVDAGLVDIIGGNYDLLGSSTAIDSGMTQADADGALGAGFVNIPDVDIAGRSRLVSAGLAPDMGAYELGVSSLYLTPDPFHFGVVDAGTSVTSTITLVNAGNVPFTFDAAKWTAVAPFSVAGPFSGLLAPGASVPNVLGFVPAAPGDYTGVLGYADGSVPLAGVTLRGATPVSVISIVRMDGDPTSAGAVQWLVTFSQPVVNADALDFDVVTTGSFAVAPAVQSAVPAGVTVLITVNTGTGDGELQLILNAASDIAEATYLTPLVNKPFAGEIYTLDNVAPVIVSIVPREGVATPTSVTSVIYDVTFSEAVSGVTAANFSVVAVDGFATGSITGIVSAGGTASDTVWQVTVGNLASTNATGGYLRLDLSDVTGIGDKFFNPIALTAIGGSIWVDNVGPSINPLTSVEATSGATVGNVFATTVTFSEAVTGVTADKLTITTDGVTILAPTGLVSVSATQYVFLLDDVYGSGPVTLNFTLNAATGDTIMDAAGIPFVTTQWSIIKDVSIVQVVIASAQVASGELTSRTQVTFHVNFSSPVTGFDPETQPGDLLLVNCAYVPGSFAVVSGTDYNFTVSPLGQGAASVRVPSNVCQTPAPPIRPNGDSNLYSVVFDTISPSFAGLTATPSRLQTDTTTTLNFTASEPLMADPIVTVNGNAAALVSQAGQNYTYEYFVPATDPESSATISMTGTDLAGATSTTLVLTALYVDKTAPVATIQSISPDSNALVTVDFSEGVTGVSAGDFTMTLNGAPFTGITNFTVVSPSQCTFNVPNAATGIYVLTLTAAGSGIQDLAGIPMTANATATWAVAPGAAVVKHWTRY